MKSLKRSVICFLLLSSFALAGSIPIGKIIYSGTSSDGTYSIFDVYLTLPSGVTQADIEGLPPTIYVNGHAYTFVISGASFPHFFLVSGLSPLLPSPCPCALTQIMFYANPGTKVTYLGVPRTLNRLSVSTLRPTVGNTYLTVGQKTTIYLNFPGPLYP